MSKYSKLCSIPFFLFILVVMPVFRPLHAQTFDYESYPELDFDFLSVDLTLGLQPQNLRLNGAAVYEIKANIAGADTVILNAARLDISSVLIDEREADFMLHNDSLFIPLNSPSERGQTYKLYIRYSASPRFGLLRNANSTVWTSQLPRSHRHWMPVADNPHVQLKAALHISVPSGFDVYATGQKTGEEAVSADVVTYHFASGRVPVSGLAFSIGRFSADSALSGDTQIRAVAEDMLADSVDFPFLLQSASQYLTFMEEKTTVDFPFKELDIFIFEDHNWETASWGSGTVYLYKNRGNLLAQLARGIAAQWFGVYQRVGQWSQADGITLYQTLMARSLSDSTTFTIKDRPYTPFSTIYDNFGVKRWNEWQKNLKEWAAPSLNAIIEETAGEVLAELPEVTEWDDYARYWYRKSGQPRFDTPDFPLVRKDTAAAEVKADSIVYRVVYKLDEAEGELTLNFSAVQGSYDELTTLRAYEIYPSKIDTTEVTFTGTEDSVVLKVSPLISTLRLSTRNHPDLKLDEYKPAGFLIYELRNGETIGQRAEAARKLGRHDENPDLQLAITDFMNKETNPTVKAALLMSLAQITKGAAGTGQIFIRALDSKDLQVRNAALMALQHYKNDPDIISRVKQFALKAEDIQTFRKGVKVLTAIMTPEEFSRFAEGLMEGEAMNRRAVFAIQQLANMGEVEHAIKKASLFLEPRFDYEIRSTALNILIQHTKSDWLSRAKELLESFDPRIRYLTVSGFQQDLEPTARTFLREYMQDEYDARVYFKIEQLLQ